MVEETILDRERDEYLKSLYENESLPSGFSSMKRLYDYAKKEGKFPISLREVKKWLSGNLVYTTHKSARKHFQRLHYISPAKKIGYQLDMDSIHFKEYSLSSGNNVAITMVDEFSRKAYVVPVRSLKGKVVASALDKFLLLISPPRCPLPTAVPNF